MHESTKINLKHFTIYKVNKYSNSQILLKINNNIKRLFVIALLNIKLVIIDLIIRSYSSFYPTLNCNYGQNQQTFISVCIRLVNSLFLLFWNKIQIFRYHIYLINDIRGIFNN